MPALMGWPAARRRTAVGVGRAPSRVRMPPTLLIASVVVNEGSAMYSRRRRQGCFGRKGADGGFGRS